MMNFVWASLFLLHLALGNDEIAEEEISKFLYDYASHYSDYLYATAEYYTDNTTILPTMYTVYAYNEGEEFFGSLGLPLQCHLPLLLLLSLLHLLL